MRNSQSALDPEGRKPDLLSVVGGPPYSYAWGAARQRRQGLALAGPVPKNNKLVNVCSPQDAKCNLNA